VTQGIEDCFQVAIVDCGEGDMKEFINKLVDIWLKIYGLEDLRDIMYIIVQGYIETGELQICEKENKLVRNREEEVLTSYKLLWGRDPREGHLTDDETGIKVGCFPR
jgi:hypothetical protein